MPVVRTTQITRVARLTCSEDMAGVWQHVNMAAVVVFLKGVLFIWICVHHLIPPSHNTQLPKKLQLGFGGVGCFFVYMSVFQLVTSTVQ